MLRISTEQRQNMIIDEAIKIIHDGGYQSLSIREIATKVKISEPAIYRHFLNKEDIILGILNRILDFDYLLEKEINSKKTGKAKVEQFIMFHFDFLQKNPEMTSVIFSEEMYSQSDILKKKFIFIIKKRKELLLNVLQDARAANEIKTDNIAELIMIILGLIRMVVFEWRLSGFSYSLPERGKKTIQLLESLIFIN